MLYKRIIGTIASVLLAVLCTGCSFSGLSDNDLLQPPKATGEKAEIQGLLEVTTNGDYTLKYPQSGDYRSAIIMQDLNSDGDDEAVAFYRNKKDSSAINIMFMDKVGGKWASVGTFSNANSDVDRIYFGDIDSDGINEAIVGWSSYLTGGSQVTMYKYKEGSVSEVIVNDDTNYADMVFMDITNDGVSDLIILTTATENDTGKSTALARLYSSCANKKFSRVSEIKTNPNVVSYSQIMQGTVSDGVNGLFVDGNTSSLGELITEVIYYSSQNKSLVSPLDVTKNDGTVTNVTQRVTSSVCKDIDEDGIIEVPSQFTPILTDDKLTPCPITKWYKIDADRGEMKQTIQTIASYFDGFYFILPDNWKNHVVAVNDNTSRTTTFYCIKEVVKEDNSETPTEAATVPELDSDKADNTVTAVETEKQPVLTIKVFSEKDWKNDGAARLSDGYSVLEESNSLVYTCKLGASENGQYNLSSQQVSKYFKLI